ncbi:MAG: HEAT repeat domain-containing protein [Chloroflexi bacterium]|nr:HEAT repeat domain-containing protein [Chloroflexota bacterium]
MRFDPLSFLLGAGSVAGISFVLWRSRERLARLQESTGSQIEGTREYLGRSASARYTRDLSESLQRHHLAGSLFPLADVLIEPRIIPPPPPLVDVDPSEVTVRDVFDVVPRFHDMPQSYAPYNIETLALADLGAGDRHVALLGICGMGKTTALVTLALMALGEVRFETLQDLTEQAILEEEQSLTKEERELRARERAQIQARAMDKLHDAHERERAKLTQAARTEDLPRIAIPGLLPILAHIRDVDLNPALYGKDSAVDPAEPLVRAAARHVSAVTSQVVGSVLYPELAAGRALILIDGYDELSPAAREPYFGWLRQLIEVYGQNLIVIAGPAEGYRPLTEIGFTPAFLRPWREDDYDRLAHRWADAWADRNAPPEDHAMRRLRVDNRGRSILDVTLKIWAGLGEDARQTGRAGWYDAWINRRLANPAVREMLPALAAQMLDGDPPPQRAALEETLAGQIGAPAEGQKPVKAEDLFNGLLDDDLLIRRAGDTFSFPHNLIMAFLASETLIEAGPPRAAEVALHPNWQNALAFAAAQINMQPAIQRKLTSAPDLIFDNLFGLVNWLSDAPPEAPWRGEIFKRLAAALMAPDQYPAVRARAVAALIATRDRNVLFVFRQALRSADPYIRRLGCIGLGALGNPEAIRDLDPMLGNDDPDVQLAAGLALGAIGTEAALEVMVTGLMHGSEDLRRAVAEALAAIPGDGHEILRDGIQHDDLLIRRATVYGLSRVKAPWALVALYRAMLEDEQWYVRTAAEDAFMAARSPDREGPRAHPEADALVWLIDWAAGRGEGVPAGPNARQVLIRVLQEGDPMYRTIAAQTLARLGHVGALKPLYGVLRDRHPEVRAAAYAALADLQMTLGEPLPSVL